MEGVLIMNHAETNVAREEFLSFRLGNEDYAIDILQVREIRAHEPVTHIANAPAYLKGVINLRGAIVPIVDMRVKLALAKADYDATTVLIILNIASRPVGIVVDAVSDVVKLAPGEIRPPPTWHGGIETGFIKGLASVDDRLLIVMDIAGLLMAPDAALVEKAAA
jgi:purine-binding chemotaxis protein CheW